MAPFQSFIFARRTNFQSRKSNSEERYRFAEERLVQWRGFSTALIRPRGFAVGPTTQQPRTCRLCNRQHNIPMTMYPADVLRHVVDVHCHPTESYVPPESMDRLGIRVCAMSTHRDDQSRVCNLALKYPEKVIPCFGHHPWFCHHISLRAAPKREHYRSLFLREDQPAADSLAAFEELLPLLPEPLPLEDVLSGLRSNFMRFESTAALLGEVGLDRIYRVAYDYYASPRRLSPFTIPLDHQLAILEAQIDLAVELGRSVSLHSVKCPQPTVTLLDNLKLKHGRNWSNIRIDIHSCSVDPQVISILQKKHPNVFMSVSTTINGRSKNLKALIAACDPRRLLIESDYPVIDGNLARCVEILDLVAETKGWTKETEWLDEVEESHWGVVRRLEANWNVFKGERGM
ncbi:unnamed protein product [Mycena citricolor]|uniref:Metallo-dependent hydrolase n=1 Tax=Mycena citricolor TaxID=2018698 RepID=A0AAD2HT48_9AGAR|nr:unnamed protein product [Mycena citricolor]